MIIISQTKRKCKQMQLKDRTILHIDANNFFASVETINKPELKNQPVAVAGNPKKRTGIILAKNELAKKFGVATGEPLWQAKQKCPDLVFLPPHHDLYEQYSKKLLEIYKTYTDKIEQFGIDECWLDITGSIKLFGSADTIANTIRERVKKELNLTVSVGISFCKIFAKLGSDLKKPDAVTTISRENFKQIVYPLPISALMGIGKKTKVHFNKMNVFCLGDITKLPTKILSDKFGKNGIELKQQLEGFDIDEVMPQVDPPKSVGNGTTTTVDIITEEEISATINFLCDKIAQRLRKQELSALGVGIDIKTADFKHQGKESRLDQPTNSSFAIADFAMQTLKEFWKFDTPIRSLRVKTFALLSTKELAQTSLFFDEKKEKLGFGLDYIRIKYGNDSLILGSSIKNDNFLNKNFDEEDGF